MITIKSSGRLGNRMFQHCFARILELELGLCYKPNRLEGFPNTYLKTTCNANPTTLRLRRCHKRNVKEIRDILNNQNISIQCTFEYYPHYSAYRDLIRNEWLKMDATSDFNYCYKNNNLISTDVNEDDLMLNIRCGSDILGVNINRLLTFDYFNIIIENTNWKRLFITSDNINSSLLKPFEIYSPIYYHAPNPINNFNFIKKFNRIAISQSTYSWWSAYLSDAAEIYFPVPIRGPWSVYRDSYKYLDLRVNEHRYKYVSEVDRKIINNYIF